MTAVRESGARTKLHWKDTDVGLTMSAIRIHTRECLRSCHLLLCIPFQYYCIWVSIVHCLVLLFNRGFPLRQIATESNRPCGV